MRFKGRDAFQRLLAVLVIVAMLGVMGIPVTVIVFFAVVTYFVWRAAQSSDRREIGRVFEFYLAANEVIKNNDRQWFGFELTELIDRGEEIVRSMPDPPPLVYFALGALYHRAGDHEAAAENLAVVVEDELAAERHRISPSPELRRYAEVLRKIERESTEAPKTTAAIRDLERARRHRAARLLQDSRDRLEAVTGAPPNALSTGSVAAVALTESSMGGPGIPIAQPPSISDVLRDVYEEEKKTA